MVKEFARLKRYNATRTIVRSAALGLAVCLLSAGVLLMLDKWNVMTVPLWCYAVGIGAGLLVGAVTFLLLRKGDLRLAERIDREFGLRERVQTMVAFQGEDSDMLRIQREDTEERLRQVKSVGAKKTAMVLHMVALVLAVAVFAVGLILPAQAVVEPPAPTEPAYEVTNWQEDAMRELIAYAEKSDMSEDAKAQVVEQLEKLLDDLLRGVTEAQMKPTVISAVSQIYRINDQANSHDAITESLGLMQDRRKNMLNDIFGNVSTNDGKLQVQAEKLRSEFGTEDGILQLINFGGDFEMQLKANGMYDETDPLFAVAFKLARDMQAIGEAYKNTLDENGENGDLDTALDQFGVALSDMRLAAGPALAQQDINNDTTVYVVKQLCRIFDIEESELPENPEESTDQDEDDQELTNGGYGSGEMQYAGDDELYDYKNNDIVHYGELINDYYAAAYEKLVSGKVDENIKQFIQDYYGILFGTDDTVE